MSAQKPADTEIAVEVTDEVDDEWQRRQYLSQIYDSYRAGRQALMQVDVSREASSREIALVCDLIRLCEPMARGSPLWADKEMGTIERVTESGGVEQHSVRGLADVLELRGGYETVQETNARLGQTVTSTVTDQMPVRILNKAFRELTMFLYERDVLVDKVGEAAAKDTQAL